MRRLYLVRHARTHANQHDLLTGRTDEHELNDVGRAQTACLASRLEAQGVRKFHSSPLRRAVQTATVLASATGISEVVIDDDLVDRDYGPFDMMSRPDLLRARAALGLSNADPTGYFPDCVQGVESLAAVQARMTRAWQRVLDYPDSEGPVGLVSHAGAIKALLYGELGIPEEQPRAFKIFQASYVRFKVPASDRLTLQEIWVNPVQ